MIKSIATGEMITVLLGFFTFTCHYVRLKITLA